MSAVLTTSSAPSTAPATAWEPFRALLLAQREDCLRERELALAETVASHPDVVAVTRAATLRDRIDEIDAALESIGAGTYGTCVSCGAAIPLERLEFRPYAVGCVGCPQSAR
jgi:DnaK suppressor protein